MLADNLTIPANTALEVEAGAIVRIDGGKNITVNGLLNLSGSSTDSIILTNSNDVADSYWSGITINSTGIVIISNSIIKQAGTSYLYPIENKGQLVMYNSSISNCYASKAIKYDTENPNQVLKYNQILGNVTSNVSLDASYNYWGNSDGPRIYDYSTNSYYGSGYLVSNNISVYPYNTSFIKTDEDNFEFLTSKSYEMVHYGKTGVDAYTGNYSKQYIDFDNNILKLSRTYNSRSEKSDILGYGWSFGLTSKVEKYLNTYIVYLPNGSANEFILTDGNYVAYNSRNIFKIEDDKYTFITVDQVIYTYNIDGKLTAITDKYGNITRISYDSNGNAYEITDSYNRIYTLEYNSDNLLTKVTDPIGRFITYTYNNNMLVKVTNVDGIETIYQYNDNKKLISIKQNDIVKSTIEYFTSDINEGKIYKVTDDSGNTTTYTYNYVDNYTTETDSSLRVTKKYYDREGYVYKIIDPNNSTTLITYNTENGINKYGEELTYTDINSNKTIYTRGSIGRIITITNPDSSIKDILIILKIIL